MHIASQRALQITYNDNKDGTVGVSYLPTEPGDYKVSVRFGDKHIQGSPFAAKVSGDKKRSQVSIESCTSVTLPGLLTDADLRTLNATIQVKKKTKITIIIIKKNYMIKLNACGISNVCHISLWLIRVRANADGNLHTILH